MAKRIIEIDGGSILTDTGSSIRNALEQAGKSDVPSVVIGSEIITPSDYDRPAPPHGMITNSTPIRKGGSLRERLLDQELELIATRFLGTFPGRRRSLELDDNTLLIRAFPLPDDYNPDYIDLWITISGYPNVPPPSINIPSNSPQHQQLDKHLGGHVFDSGWICYSYNHSWKLNPNNLLAGDCLFKFVENIFAALSGGHRD